MRELVCPILTTPRHPYPSTLVVSPTLEGRWCEIKMGTGIETGLQSDRAWPCGYACLAPTGLRTDAHSSLHTLLSIDPGRRSHRTAVPDSNGTSSPPYD